MKLTIAEPKYFKDSITIISDLVSEAKFKISSNGMELIAMDPANVAMVIFKLLPSSFVEFELKEDTELALNLNSLKQVLKRVNPNDILTLQLEENKLNIILKGTSVRNFKLPILDFEDSERRIPQLDFVANIKMDSVLFNSAIEDCDIVSESVTLMVQHSKFLIQGKGDLNAASIEMKSSEDLTISLSSEDNIQSKYSIEYLKKMMQASKIADKVNLSLSRDYPLMLEYLNPDRVQMKFILAPRVEND